MAKEKKAKAAPQPEKESGAAETAAPPAQESAAEEAVSEKDPLQKALEEKQDQYLRLAAEYDNFRKRSQKEKEGIYADCKADVVNTLLTVFDNLERCADYNENTSFEDYRKGVEMTCRQLGTALEKLGIEQFGAEGETFDPNLHNAVMHEENDAFPENTITKVLMKGYKIGDKIIRAAMVAVAN